MSKITNAIETETTPLSELSTLAMQQAWDTTGYITRGNIPERDWEIMRSNGLVLTEKSKDGEPYECVKPDSLEAERDRRFAAGKDEFLVAHFDETLDADTWLHIINVTPKEAAALLCRSNPRSDADDPASSQNDQTGPLDFTKMLRVFDDVAGADACKKSRTLRDWHDIAASRGLKYHSWIDSYKALNPLAYGVNALAADAESTDEKGATDAAPPPKRRINKNRAILQSFFAAGIGKNIESIWVHIRANTGKDNFPYASASVDMARHVDGDTVTKGKMERALRSLLKTDGNS